MIDEENYKTSLPDVTLEEKVYHQELNDYIIDQMKEITIHKEKSKSKPKTCVEVVARNYQTIADKNNEESTSNDSNWTTLSDGCNTDSLQESNGGIAQSTTNIAQIKLIKESQESVKKLQSNQQQILTCVSALVDTVIALSDIQ